MSPVTLTIAIPTVNRASSLKARLQELESQYKGNFRILICDNGSTDGTHKLVQDNIRRLPYLDYFRVETNQGVDRNILNCYFQSKTKYVWFNSDNYPIEPEACTKVLDALTRWDPTVATFGISSTGDNAYSSDEYNQFYYSESELGDYRIFFRTFCLTGIVVRRMTVGRSCLDHAIGSWFTQLALCLEVLGQRFVYAHLPLIVVARRNVNRRKSRPYLDLWLNGPLRALKVDGAALDYNKIQQFMAKTWKDYFITLLAAKVGLYNLNMCLNKTICSDAWHLLGWRSLIYFACNVCAWCTPLLFLRFLYRYKLVLTHGRKRGEELFRDRTASAAQQSAISSY